MKAILEFNLPEDESNCLRAIHADEAWNTIVSIEYLLRQHYKHDVAADVVLKNIRNEIADMTCFNICSQ